MDLPEYHRRLLARWDEELERLQSEDESRRLDDEAEEVARRSEQELRRTLGARIPVDAVRAVFPANADPLAPQDPERVERFRKHLTAMAEGAVLDRERLEVEPAGVEPPANGREAVSANACAACRGSCCRMGGDHAYLTEETLARALAAHPDWTLDRILELYLSRLPAETTRDSCLYHGAAGCGLPRELRSPTCNLYLCGKLTRLRAGLPESQPPPVLAVMFDRGRWTRTALIDERGAVILSEDAPPTEP